MSCRKGTMFKLAVAAVAVLSAAGPLTQVRLCLSIFVLHKSRFDARRAQ
jgi:hypothetical protein